MTDATVVIPVYKEDAQAVTKTYNELKSLGFSVIVVDDGSDMKFPTTVNTISYPKNVGYGHALKTGIAHSKTPITITMDGDSQHTIADVERLYRVYKLRPDLKMVVGQRWLTYEPFHRSLGRKLLNFIASIIAGHYMVDLNSGLRVFDTEVVKGYAPILCNTFSFTTSLTVSMVADNHKIAYYPIDVKPRGFGRSHVKLVKDGLITLWYIIYCGVGCRTRRLRAWFRSLVM